MRPATSVLYAQAQNLAIEQHNQRMRAIVDRVSRLRKSGAIARDASLCADISREEENADVAAT